MSEPTRPDPDELLAAIRKDEARSRSGRMKIFFGMSAGVGKTYAMLKAAQDRLRDGVDVVIGTVETHGRADTEALLTGLPAIPRKLLTYKDAKFAEMDIDAILARRPQLLLVDELAHTNVPGSRHPKRWHDVVELLDAGIDVFTTVNVQHIESRKEPVEAITGVTIRETVPDSILERADQIILIDITPAELLERLKEGKVYLGDMARAAAENFFKEDRLTALREIALRLTAEKVDNELQGMIISRERETSWKTTERLMVAVSHSPYSEGLIRATRRLAFGMEAPWLGVHIDTGLTLSHEDRATLGKNLALVRELGGEVVSVVDVDVPQALKRVAEQHSVTQLVIGRPTRRLFKDMLHSGTILDRLVRESGSFDVHVLRQERPPGGAKRSWGPKFESGFAIYAGVVGLIAGLALLASLLVPIIGYRAVGFLFLLTVLALGMFVSIGPILVGAVASALIWDFFFIPPGWTFRIHAPEDFAMCAAYLLVAITTGTLTHRIRRRERMLRLRERRTQMLYDIVRIMARAPGKDEFIPKVAERLGAILEGECSVAIATADKRLEQRSRPPHDWCVDDKEWAVARWVFENGKPGGWSTETLPGAAGMYLPLKGTSEVVGVLAFHSAGKARLLQEEEDLLFAVVQQLAISLERDLLQERARQVERLAESERLYQMLLNSVSHEIRTPLTAIAGVAEALQNEKLFADSGDRRQLTKDLNQNVKRLNHVVSNLLNMSRLSAGTLSLKKDWHDVNDLLATVLDTLKDSLARHTLKLHSAESLPLLRIDFELLEQALCNLLANAALHTPPGTIIEITVQAEPKVLRLSLADTGPGIQPEALPHLFEKFYRGPGTPPGGLGLGLAISKAIIEAHGGTISAGNRAGGGAIFMIHLPVEPQPPLPMDFGAE